MNVAAYRPRRAGAKQHSYRRLLLLAAMLASRIMYRERFDTRSLNMGASPRCRRSPRRGRVSMMLRDFHAFIFSARAWGTIGAPEEALMASRDKHAASAASLSRRMAWRASHGGARRLYGHDNPWLPPAKHARSDGTCRYFIWRAACGREARRSALARWRNVAEVASERIDLPLLPCASADEQNVASEMPIREAGGRSKWRACSRGRARRQCAGWSPRLAAAAQDAVGVRRYASVVISRQCK